MYPGFSLTFAHGLGQPAGTLAENFPDEADSIHSFFALRDQIFEEAGSVPRTLGLKQLDAAAREFPNLFKYRGATLATVLDEQLSDPRVKAVIASLWPYQGSPPERVGFILYAQYLAAFMLGSHYAKGSIGTCVDALAAALQRDGGELIVNSPAAKILVEDGRARGVRLGDGRELRAPLVVSNADATATWEVGGSGALAACLRTKAPAAKALILGMRPLHRDWAATRRARSHP